MFWQRQATSSASNADRAKYLFQVLKISQEQLPYLALWWQNDVMAIQTKYVYDNFNGLYYNEAWLTKIFNAGYYGGRQQYEFHAWPLIWSSVLTTVGSPEKAEQCKKWGADGVLSYKTDDVPARVKEFAGEFATRQASAA